MNKFAVIQWSSKCVQSHICMYDGFLASFCVSFLINITEKSNIQVMDNKDNNNN